jgi:DNA-binding CsgD family transcriptional regulator
MKPQHRSAMIAELAVANGFDSNVFRRLLLEHLDRWSGVELCCLQSSKDGGRSYQVEARGFDASLLAQRASVWVGELAANEVASACGNSLIPDDEIFTITRKDQLALYRELLRPCGVRVYVSSIWKHGNGIFGLGVARGRHRRAFRHRELMQLESLLPSIRVAEAYVSGNSASSTPSASAGFERWAAGIELTEKERRVAELVIRGLRNKEIALLTNTSVFTVRNQLASIFGKADVTSRAELVFIATNTDQHMNSAGATHREPAWFSIVANAHANDNGRSSRSF